MDGKLDGNLERGGRLASSIYSGSGREHTWGRCADNHHNSNRKFKVNNSYRLYCKNH
jgi:hypothetical protein